MVDNKLLILVVESSKLQRYWRDAARRSAQVRPGHRPQHLFVAAADKPVNPVGRLRFDTSMGLAGVSEPGVDAAEALVSAAPGTN
jgi:hypothetical protein